MVLAMHEGILVMNETTCVCAATGLIDIDPIDMLRIQYAQSVQLAPSPENAISAESWLQPIRDAATYDEKAEAWRHFGRLPLPRKAQ